MPSTTEAQNPATERFQQLYRSVLDSALDCIITIDSAGKILEFNPAAERVFGYSREEAVGQELAELIIPERMRGAHRQGLARYLQTGNGPVLGKRLELAGLRKDGSEILVELAITVTQFDHQPVFTAYLRNITEQRRDEEASRHLAAIVESSADAIVSKDLNGIVTTWNAAAEQLFGFTVEEIIHKPITMIVPPDRIEEEQHIMELIRRGERAEFFDTLRLRKDGTLINVALSVSPIRDRQGRVVGASKIVRDITERKKSEEQFRITVEAAPSGMIMADEQGRIVLVNSHAERLFGYNRTELIGQPVEMLVPERFRARHPTYRASYAAEPSTRAMGAGRDLYGLRKDGTEVPVEIGLSPVKTSRGVMVLSTIVDISVRKQTERRRVAQYTIGSLLAGSWTLDEASIPVLQTIASIEQWDLSAIWLINDKTEALECKAVWHRPDSALKKFAEASRATQLEKGKGLPGRVWTSAEPVWIRDVVADPNFPRATAAAAAKLHGGFAFPLFAGGVVNGVVEVFSERPAEPDPDLLQLVQALGSQIGLFIERRRIESELELERKRAIAANAAKDRFLAMLSHELRTPLTPVLIWADAVADDPDLSSELREGLQMICRNVELEARLIDDLLDLTRISRGKLTLQPVRADVHELIRHAIGIVEAELQNRQCALSVSLEATAHHVKVDPSRIQQVFWNVLRNACKFSTNGGGVSVRSFNPAPDKLAVTISDKGVGIESENLEKIFNAFEQLETRREGLGLGLSISKAIVEMHGGTIHAESEGIGKGATFVIKLPLAL